MKRRELQAMLLCGAITLSLGLCLAGCGGGGDAAGDLSKVAESPVTGKSPEEQAKYLNSMRPNIAAPGVRIPPPKKQQ
jgi:hypothetical protein